LNETADKIANEIRETGAISFARFMELALYCPVCGFYDKEEDTIGRGGDYYTSVSVGSLFGELLAFQFAQWLEDNPKRDRSAKSGVPSAEGVELVEAGAHDGGLARDILGWLKVWRAKFFARLEYWIVEPSPRRQEWQKRTLAELTEKVHWAKTIADLRPRHPSLDTCHFPGIRGIMFANELLDALPVHRLGWDAKRRVWFEWGVTLKGGRFVWTRPSGQAAGVTGHGWLASLDPQISALLPDGFTVEICPAAEEWWCAAARVLERGKLLTLDYGLTAEEFLVPEREGGTLRGYLHHRLSSNVLAHPGEEDITAHVNFTAIQAAGESAGLETEACLTQSQFLTQVAAQIWDGQGSFGEWTAQRTRQFQTLTHPEHLGRSFRVLVQGRSQPWSHQHQGGGDCSS
jgi:SAM-dependent MidA family methyltransferase